ncbi:hypothetical protein O1611_g3677 [Lasiodiplodia mahajangana]|uniref:Uncharacterized protein n=1 Tax=Lasiodiplodia mahajangana TaxID=1108764 RepID=A0ACC2JR18_9PEZI|nr:hypothetical protein O1611_g3677 [Lasiodiplodia mahajangana]
MEPPSRMRRRNPGSRVGPRDADTRDMGPYMLDGCCHEAMRADKVSACLQQLRSVLPENLHPHLTAVIDQLRVTSQLLRDLADKSQIYLSQVPVMIDYLNVILPCLCRTLRDILGYYENKTMDKAHRWRAMYHNMSNELPGTSLPARFVMYNQFLGLLNYMLTRDPNFDVNAMEALRIRILQLRDARKIDPPVPYRTDLVRRDNALDFWRRQTDSHWAEAIFTQPLPSRREFKRRGKSDAFGPLDRMGQLEPFSSDVKILVKRTFEDGRVSIIIFLRQDDQLPFILVRTSTGYGELWVSIRPINSLTIEREASSVLHISYWEPVQRRNKAWASLAFLTWEELVLFYCTFISLKYRDEWTQRLNPHELRMGREKRLFSAQIIEDGYRSCLMVMRDKQTKGIRLHVVSWDGPFARCPVWTAFVPPGPVDDWLIHKDQHRIWLRDLQVYSFCNDYQPHRQRKRSGAFQIKFAHARAAASFKGVFNPIPDPSVEDASDDLDDDSSTHSED